MGETGYQRRAVILLELVEFRTIDNAGDQFARIIGLAQIARDDAVKFMWIVKWRNHFAKIETYLFLSIQVSDDAPGNGQRMRIIHA